MTNEGFPAEKFSADESELMFGQVREDAAVDLYLLDQISDPKRILVIASGGCTAFSMAGKVSCRIDALDISGSQIAISNFKKLIFQQQGFEAGRRACIENGLQAFEELKGTLSPFDRTALERVSARFAKGLNQSGSVDHNLGRLRSLFYILFHSKSLTERFLSMDAPAEQLSFYEQKWNTGLWKLAMKIAFNKSFLQLLHGREAGRLIPENFSETMENRLRGALTRFPNQTNPYSWQTFLGKYPSAENGLPPYLQQNQSQTMINNLDNLNFERADLLDWLDKQNPNSIDYFGLSNVLELMPANYNNTLLPKILRCARPGAIICIRAIFPKTRKQTFPNTNEQLKFDEPLAQAAQEMDRSPFCNLYEIYRCS